MNLPTSRIHALENGTRSRDALPPNTRRAVPERTASEWLNAGTKRIE